MANRFSKTVNGQTTYYLVDTLNPTGYPQVLEELTSNSSLLTPSVLYTWGHALLHQDRLAENDWQTSFYGYDGQGSVRYLTDNAGQITDTYDYDAFGNLLARTGDTPNNYLYQGEQFDHDLGLYYLRARYADPDRGRFWTMDSFEGFGSDPASLHKYTFCHNDPVNNRDPSGHSPFAETMTVSGLAPMVKGAVEILKRNILSCNVLTATMAGMQGAAFGGLISGAITTLIGSLTGDLRVGEIADAIAEGAEFGFVEGFLLGLSPPVFMGFSALMSMQAGLDFWQTLHDPEQPAWMKVVKGAAFVGSILPALSPKLARKMNQLLDKFCFPAGTKIATQTAEKDIEHIEAGDLVWSQSGQTGEASLKRVKTVFASVASALVVLQIGTSVVEATPEHPFWVADEGWKSANQIEIGDQLFSRHGERFAVEHIEHKQGQFAVYNFEVEDFHTYFVGGQGLLVHNKCQLHHLIPWENSFWKHHEHALVKAAGLTQKDLKKYSRNVINLEHHAGPHSYQYHEEVNRRMDDALSRLTSTSPHAAQSALDKVMADIAGDIASGKLAPYNTKSVFVVP